MCAVPRRVSPGPAVCGVGSRSHAPGCRESKDGGRTRASGPARHPREAWRCILRQGLIQRLEDTRHNRQATRPVAAATAGRIEPSPAAGATRHSSVATAMAAATALLTPVEGLRRLHDSGACGCACSSFCSGACGLLVAAAVAAERAHRWSESGRSGVQAAIRGTPPTDCQARNRRVKRTRCSGWGWAPAQSLNHPSR